MTTSDFRGTDRFTIRRRLGSGGMGVVYEAYDRVRNERVALKTLLRADAGAIFRFKREFRTLADLVHPNLVSLYELHVADDQWFFTMELVDGVPFTKYVRRPAAHGRGATDHDELDEARLRSSLRQLATGVQALHDAGIVHRDLKPSNVLVSADGRVRVFDFGIASAIVTPGRDVTVQPEQFGTPQYMSPEQAAGGAPAMAGDWYAVGVVLYESLTGRLPYTGDNFAVMLQKLRGEPRAPETLAPDAPPDLCEICQALMARDVSQRMGGVDLLRRLGSKSRVPTTGQPAVHDESKRAVVGRDRELGLLRAALRDVRDGQAVSVYVHGESGWGKSTLVDRFLDEGAGKEHTVILAGRCYDRESMPYKALDGIIDSLTTFLRSLPADRVEALLPRDVLAIARLFPVLRHVDAIESTPQRDVEIPDPIELRRRAVAAFRELLARLSDRYVLVMFIDDLQWADADSMALVDDLLRAPNPPALLLVVAFRSEEVASRPFLKALLDRADDRAARALWLGPLSDDAAREFVRSLAGPAARDRVIESIVREAAGSPFLLEQLSHYVLESDASSTAAIGLREMLDSRMVRLPTGARQLLEVLAVARHPIDAETAYRAADLDGEFRPLVGTLLSAHLLRSTSGPLEIDVYHDRIRDALLSGLDADLIRRIHLRLATSLSERPDSDPARLYEHYLGAGESDLARAQAVDAAERAAAALAFDRAARFYANALDLSAAASGYQSDLRAKLGEALANAGRPADAANAFLAASGGVEQARALELRRRAAEQLLFGGHNDRGLDVMRELLGAVNLRMPVTQRETMTGLIAGRLQIRIRGYRYREHREDTIPQIDLLRIDTCGACAFGLSLVDPILAAYFGTRYLLLALAAGEPRRIARALAVEVGFAGSRGGVPDRRSEHLLQESLALAERVGSPRELGLALVTAGSSRVLRGQWAKSVELLQRADDILRERCTGVLWELTTCQTLLLSALMYRGRFSEVARRLPFMLGDAQERGNLYAATEARTRGNFCWLALDDPDRARAEADEALQRWSHKGFHRQHNNAVIANINTDLYLGLAGSARERVEAHWRVVSGTLMMRVQLFRIEIAYLRARAALALAAERPGNVEELLASGNARAEDIAREKMPWADPFVPLIRASSAAVRGDHDGAATLLRTAATGFDAADMTLYAAVTRRRLGQVLKGADGDRMVRDADALIEANGVKRPDRFAGVVAPGSWN